MTMNLLDFSGKIDSFTIELYEVLSTVAAELGIRFFVVGATARDLILERTYNIPPVRATQDIDLAVQVADWNQFEALKTSLLSTGKFGATKVMHRLQYGDAMHPVDLVPFGEIGSLENSITWPPEHAVRMSIAGFEECFQASVTARLRQDPLLEIKIVSLPGLALLKILAWRDRRDNRDAKDLAAILRNYSEAGNADRLYEDAVEVLEEEGFDDVNAAARLLGMDMAAISNQDLHALVAEILEEETWPQDNYRLVTAMRASRLGEDFERNLELLQKLSAGYQNP